VIYKKYYLIIIQKKSFPKDHKVNFSKNTKKDYKNKMIICRSYKMDEDLSFELLQKHDGNLQKVLFDYYSKKSVPKDHKVNFSKKNFPKKMKSKKLKMITKQKEFFLNPIKLETKKLNNYLKNILEI